MAKEAFYAWDASYLGKRMTEAENLSFDERMKTSDVVEGINAFLEKQGPVSNGS